MSTLSLSGITALFGDTGSGSGSSLLATLYGGTGTSSDAASSLAALKNAEANGTKLIAAEAKDPAVSRDVTAFRSAVANATDAKSLLGNAAFMKVFLTANGLSDQIDYPALAKKALLSDTSDTASLANTLTDTRWKAVAKTYDFANGLTNLKKSGVLDTLADGYAEMSWRQSLDDATPGLSKALTFRSQASSITSVDQILGDSVLRSVVTTALGLPLEIALQPLEAQEKAISSRLDLSKLKDSKFVETFTQKYLIAAAGDDSSSSSNTLTLLASKLRSLSV